MKAKKILALIIAYAMAMTCMGFTAFAESVAAGVLQSNQINMEDPDETFISTEIQGLNATQSVVIKTYDANDVLLATTTLQKSEYFTTTPLSVKIIIKGDSSSWTTIWEEGKLRADYVPAYGVLYVDGQEMNKADFYMRKTYGEEAVEWGDVPGVPPAPAVAQIGDTTYGALAEAFENAVKGDAITLLSDVTITEQIKVVDSSVLSDLTIDGGNYTISAGNLGENQSVLYLGDPNASVWCTGVKIKDLTIDAEYARFGIFFCGGTSSDLTNVTVKGDYFYYGINLYGTHGATMTDCDIVSMFTNGSSKNPLTLINTKVGTLTANASEVEDSGKITIGEGSSVDKLYLADGRTDLVASGIEKATTVINGEADTDKAGLMMDASWYNDAGTSFTISDKADLYGFANLVNSGITFAGKTVTLAADIDLNDEEWTPIGNSTNKFQGIFDGGNHTISNLKITGNNSNVGLFGFTINGEIKNLTINNANVSGRLNVGALAGTPYTSDYSNIKLTGHVEINGMSYVGGVGGKNAYADWTDIEVNVDGESYVYANSVENGTAYRTYAGGVIGFMGEGGQKLTNITSNIAVKGTTCDVGGIVGIAHYGNVLTNVSCSGNVTITDAGELADAKEIGGIAGVWHNADGTTVTFEDCTFTGELSSTYTDESGEKVTLTTSDFANGGLIGSGYSATGTGEMVIDYAAYIGTDLYETLEEAIEAVEEGETIVLLSDIALSKTVTINNNKTFTIDGNGKTITNAGTTIDSAFVVGGTSEDMAKDPDDSACTYTIKNIVFDGWTTKHIVRCQGVKVALDNITFQNSNQTSGLGLLTLTYTDAEVTNCKFIDNTCLECIDINSWGDGSESTANISGCTFENNTCTNFAVILQIKGNMTVDNCTFNENTVKDGVMGTVVFMAGPAGDEIAITNNTFTGNTVTASTDEVSGAINAGFGSTVSGNTYSGNTANGVELDDNSVATVGGLNYRKLQAAIDAANDGDTITLLNDVSLSGQNCADMLSGKVIDLNQKTLTLEGNTYLTKETTIKNGNIEVTGAITDSYLALHTADTTLILDAVNITGTFDAYAVLKGAEGSTLVIKNSTIDVTGNISNPDEMGNIIYGGNVTIDASAIKGNNTVRGIGLADVTVQNDSNIEISNVETGFNCSSVTLDNSTATITNATKRAIRLNADTLTLQNGSTLTATDCAEDIIGIGTEGTDKVSVDSTSTLNAKLADNVVDENAGGDDAGDDTTDDNWNTDEIGVYTRVYRAYDYAPIMSYPDNKVNYRIGLYAAADSADYAEYGFAISVDGDKPVYIPAKKYGSAVNVTVLGKIDEITTAMLTPETAAVTNECIFGQVITFSEDYDNKPFEYRPYVKTSDGTYKMGEKKTVADIYTKTK